MYTQCPDCGTVFRVTARALRAARGQVRCGICSASFSALEYLSERPLPRSEDEGSGDETITVEELPGTEFIELSEAQAQEDARLAPDDESIPDEVPTDAGETGEPTAGPDTGDLELEFHGTDDDLEKLFVPLASSSTDSAAPAGGGDDRVIEFTRAIDRIAASDLSGIEVVEEERAWPSEESQEPDPADIAAVLAFRRPDEPPPPGQDSQPGDPDQTDEFPILVLDERDHPEGEGPAGAAPGPGEEAHGSEDELAEARRRFVAGRGETGITDETEESGTAGEELSPLYGSARIPIPEELRRDAALAADEIFASRGEVTVSEESSGRWPWLVAAVLLLLGLAAQMTHHWRDELARNPVAGPWLLRAYGVLGLELPAPADLAAFSLRQLGAASDASQSGRLKLRASIVNGAPFAQPYPLLRLSLQDRFGATIGVRDLEPAEYLPGGEAPVSGLMAPGQRADAEVTFVDPGRDAVGFELDVCVRAGPAVRCSGEAPSVRP